MRRHRSTRSVDLGTEYPTQICSNASKMHIVRYGSIQHRWSSKDGRMGNADARLGVKRRGLCFPSISFLLRLPLEVLYYVY